LALGDVEEDVLNLQNVGEVFFDLVAPLEDFVLVAGYLEALLAWGMLVLRRGFSGGDWAPFFMRTSETLVSLIWLDG
jgi:hypothetical protein